MASGESASVRHEEHKDSIPPAHIRQELRASDQPAGDRISGIQGGTTFHTGNIALHEPQQQQLFHSVSPMKKHSSGNEPSMMNMTMASNKDPSPQEEHTTTNQ